MTGSTEARVRATVHAGQHLLTPTGRARFEIGDIDRGGIVLLFGAGRWRTPVPWELLEEAVRSLSGRGWVLVGAQHRTDSAPGSLESIVKPALRRSAANYIAALLEYAGVCELDRRPPMRVRLCL